MANVKNSSPVKKFDDLDSIVSNLKTDLTFGNESNNTKPCDDDEMIEMTPDDNLLTANDVDVKDTDTAIQQNLKIADDSERPLSNFHIEIDSITPGDNPPRTIMEEIDGLKIMLHFAKDRPRDDISVIVITTTNHNSIAVKDYQFDASVSKVSNEHPNII